MLKAFNDYLSFDEEAKNIDSGDSTANFLLRRMRHKKDFPAFSQTINILNQASTSETESLAFVSNAILKDYSLTNKVLRMVNSAHYNRGGGKISTISRAVVMLSINPVRSIAASLMLFDHMQNKLQSHQLQEDAVQSLFSALLANKLMISLGKSNYEEAFLCALLQQLGKMLVRFYLHEESRAIDKLIAQEDMTEANAVSQVLGTSYHRLGISVAREWGFPDSIVDSMAPVDFDDLPAAHSDANNLRLVSHFCNALGACMSLPPDRQPEAIQQLTSQFSSLLDIDEKKVSSLIESGHGELIQFSKLIQFDLGKSRYFQQVSSKAENDGTAAKDQPDAAEIGLSESAKILHENLEEQIKTTDKALTDGIQDITNTLTGEYSLNQILQMILEIIYRALPGSRVVLCLKDGKANSIRARFGYGDEVDRIVANFSIPLTHEGGCIRCFI
ncbi:MAG: HDOD domain-containing protein [Gammaproteobacteria bacterium]